MGFISVARRPCGLSAPRGERTQELIKAEKKLVTLASIEICLAFSVLTRSFLIIVEIVLLTAAVVSQFQMVKSLPAIISTFPAFAATAIPTVKTAKWCVSPPALLSLAPIILCVRFKVAITPFLKGRLVIKVKQAKGLLAGDMGGTSDPYITVKVKGDTVVKTQVIKKTLDPVWNETFNIPVNFELDKLVFSVKDHDMVGVNRLGCVVFDCRELADGRHHSGW